MAAKPSYRFTLQRVRLNRAGYSSSGRYFGQGGPLYHFDDPQGYWHYCRAPDRAAAKGYVRSMFQELDARFYS